MSFKYWVKNCIIEWDYIKVTNNKHYCLLTVTNHIGTIIQWGHCKVCFNLAIVKNEIEKKLIGFRSMDNVAMRILCCMHWRAWITVHVYSFLWKLVPSLNAAFEESVRLEANIPIYLVQEMQKFSTYLNDIYFGSVIQYCWTQGRTVKRPNNHGESYGLYISMLNKNQRFVVGFAHAESAIFFIFHSWLKH